MTTDGLHSAFLEGSAFTNPPRFCRSESSSHTEAECFVSTKSMRLYVNNQAKLAYLKIDFGPVPLNVTFVARWYNPMSPS